MKEAIDSFSKWRRMKVKETTVKGYDRELRNLCLFLRNPDLTEVSIYDITEYLVLHNELGWQNNSMIPKCMAIRKFFEFYRMQGLDVVDPALIPIPRKEYNIPRVAQEEDYKRLLSAIPDPTNDPRHIRNRAIIGLLWDTGARNGEIVSLNYEDIDLEKKRAIIKTEKSRGRRPLRELFWSDETNNALADWILKREHLKTKKKIVFNEPDALFIGCAGQKVGKRLRNAGVGEMLRRYCNRAEIPYMNAHSFRHHKGHDIINQGGSAADVQNVLGHASLASSSIYTMMTNRELEKRARKFLGEAKVTAKREPERQKELTVKLDKIYGKW